MRTVPGRAGRRPAPRAVPPRSRWMVLSTAVSRPMPPGCGRVAMTHRAMGTPNRSRTSPRPASRPRSSSSPSPSRTTLARNRRRSQCRACRSRPARAGARAVVERARARPATAATRPGPGTSSSRRGSRRRGHVALLAGRAQLHPAAEPGGEERVVGGDRAVGQHDLDSAVGPQPGEQNNSSGTRRAVSPKPVSRSNSAHRRSPAMPSGVDRRLGQALALQRLHRVPPQLEDPHQAGVQPSVQVPDQSPPGSRTTRSTPSASAFGGQVIGSTARLRRCWPSGSPSPL